MRPSRGVPLGWRVGIATGVAVTIAMGVVALFQGMLARDAANRERLQLLRLIAAPLVVEVERAESLTEIDAALSRFRRNYARQALLGPTLDVALPGSGSSVAAQELRIPVVSAGLEGGRGELRLQLPPQLTSGREAEMLGGWALHLIATLVVVIVFLLAVLRLLVVRPLAKLVDAVRKMEMGYWHAVRDPGGAWEVRWLAWRFSEMGRRLDLAVKNLVHAERAAATAPRAPKAPAGDAQSDERATAHHTVSDSTPGQGPDPEPGSRAGEARRRHLLGVADTLAKGLAVGRRDIKIARATWREHASEAERRGDMRLAARLEDLALRTLHPEAYAELALRLEVGRERRRTWAKEQEAGLTRLLREAGCAASTVEHRVKSTASVYRKMRTKGLELDEVHDLFAFRVVVPSERECYLALGAIHRSFEPLLGRFSDYIASPKPSGYRSLHTIVRPTEPGAPIFEIQIRSAEMHSLAEHGSAAHWRYKRGSESSRAEAATSSG